MQTLCCRIYFISYLSCDKEVKTNYGFDLCLFSADDGVKADTTLWIHFHKKVILLYNCRQINF